MLRKIRGPSKRLRLPKAKAEVTRYTGTAVFLAGLKNGIFTTRAVTRCRMASIVISICNLLSIFECSVSTLAKAISFFNNGDHVVEVAFPTCFSPK